MKTDTLFYRLFKDFPQFMLELLGLDYSGNSYRFASEEIKQTAFRLDGVFVPLNDNPEQPLIFAEVQFQPDDDFYDRLFTEIALFLRHKKPEHCWQALVIYPNRKVERAANRGFLPFMDLPQLHIVYLEDFLELDNLPPVLELGRLIICDEVKTIELARKLARESDKITLNMLNFIETILAYKLPRLTRKEVKEMLALDDNQLKKSRFYQEVLEEGLEQGVEQGIEQGRDEAKHLWLHELLTQKFGQLPQATQQRINQADSVQLDKWMRRFLAASTLDDVFNDG